MPNLTSINHYSCFIGEPIIIINITLFYYYYYCILLHYQLYLTAYLLRSRMQAKKILELGFTKNKSAEKTDCHHHLLRNTGVVHSHHIGVPSSH